MITNHKYCRIISIVAIFFLGQSQHLHATQTANPSNLVAHNAGNSHGTPEQLIALDLVGVLMQTDKLSVNNTSFSMHPPTDPFSANLRQTLEMAGYEMMPSGKHQASTKIDYQIKEKKTDKGIIRTYQLNAGPIKVRRDYLIAGNTTQPTSTIYLRGAEASRIYLNDEIFNLTYNETYDDSQSAPEFIQTESAQTPAAQQILISTIDQATTYRVNDQIVISVTSNLDSQIHCYYQDGHGQIVKIYPNRFNTDSMTQANRQIMIPATDEWNISATRVGANDDFLCIATDPLNNSLLSILNKEPDLEPLAARSLDQIQETLATSSNRPIQFQKLSLTVR